MIKYPPLLNGKIPTWDKDCFVIDNKKSRILYYSNNEDGWNDELTNFHEEETDDGNNPIDLYSRNNAVKNVLKYTNDKKLNILEIGCSSGYLLKNIKNKLPDAYLVGADIVSEPLQKLGYMIPDVPLVQMDILNCPFKEEQFDVVIALNVLEHIKDDRLAMKNIYRMLKPNGIVIVEVPAGPNLYDVYDSYLMHFRRYSKNQIYNLFKENSLKVMHHRNIGCLVYPAFFLTKKINRYRYGINGEKADDKKNIVKEKINSTNKNILFELITKLEENYIDSKNLPGIRFFAVAKK